MLLFSTDIDGTIFDGPETAQLFADFWSELRALPEPPLLVYNTGRLLNDVQELIGATTLPTPDLIIAGVGTQIFDFSRASDLAEWKKELSGHWDFDQVFQLVQEHITDIEAQPDECQNEFKCSYFYRDKNREDLDRIRNLLESSGLEAQVVYSSNRDLDILPLGANKGNALRWLATWKEVPLNRVAVAGDSGNDSSMFLVEEVYGVVVSNAEKALVQAVDGLDVFLSSKPCAHGVIEGLSSLLGLDTASHSPETTLPG
ncbi:MAG: HAD-IIB family hydrolase [Verrucomicrobiota bacterium]